MKICVSLAFTFFVLHELLLQHSWARPQTKIAIFQNIPSPYALKLLQTFDAWNMFPPRSGSPIYSADLLIFFSKSLTKFSDIVDIINNVGSAHTGTNDWRDCIHKMIGICCDIEPSLNIYNQQEFRTNSLWINGPNRQFEGIMHVVQRSSDGPYDFIRLMGMDIIPIDSSRRDFATMRR